MHLSPLSNWIDILDQLRIDIALQLELDERNAISESEKSNVNGQLTEPSIQAIAQRQNKGGKSKLELAQEIKFKAVNEEKFSKILRIFLRPHFPN